MGLCGVEVGRLPIVVAMAAMLLNVVCLQLANAQCCVCEVLMFIQSWYVLISMYRKLCSYHRDDTHSLF